MEWELVSNLPELKSWDSGAWSIIFNPNNGDIFAYHDSYSNGRLYLSIDNGNTWIKKSDIALLSDFITINPFNENLFLSTVVNLYRSIDNGEYWEKIVNMSVNGILFTASGEIYIGCKNNKEKNFCCYSDDNGNSWIQKSSGLPKGFAPLAIGKDGTLYAKSIKGVYRSTDGGVKWLKPSNFNNVDINSLTICHNDSIFATGLKYSGIFKSTDQGVTWIQLNTGFRIGVLDGITYNPVTNDIFVTNSKVTDGNNYNNEVYKSSNLGETWILENNGLPNEYGNLAINPKTGQMFVGTCKGVFRSKNYPERY
jgi:ligand-binding sensor domain-containing protein